MKRMPGIMALFFIAITVWRVSDFLGIGLLMGPLGYIFAIGLAYCVYMAAVYAGKAESRASGITALVIFVAVDLWYNEFELVRTLSSQTLIPPSSNFMNWGADDIRYGMQVSALLFGACPTLFAAALGWMQAQGEKVKDWNKPGAWSRFVAALLKIFTGVGLAIAVKVEATALLVGGNANSSPSMLPAVDGQNGQELARRSWKSLTAEEVARIPAMSRAEMAAVFGISDGTAGNWKRDIIDGKRPWQRALTE